MQQDLSVPSFADSFQKLKLNKKLPGAWYSKHGARIAVGIEASH